MQLSKLAAFIAVTFLLFYTSCKKESEKAEFTVVIAKTSYEEMSGKIYHFSGQPYDLALGVPLSLGGPALNFYLTSSSPITQGDYYDSTPFRQISSITYSQSYVATPIVTFRNIPGSANAPIVRITYLTDKWIKGDFEGDIFRVDTTFSNPPILSFTKGHFSMPLK